MPISKKTKRTKRTKSQRRTKRTKTQKTRGGGSGPVQSDIIKSLEDLATFLKNKEFYYKKITKINLIIDKNIDPTVGVDSINYQNSNINSEMVNTNSEMINQFVKNIICENRLDYKKEIRISIMGNNGY